jgi:hypothetical protein
MLRRKNWESRRRLLGALLTLAPFLFAAGCGSSTTTITGKVYYKDKPLPGGSVTFVGPGGKGGGTSKISEDGSYSITNAPLGENTICVDTSSLKPDPRAKGVQGGHEYGPPKDANLPPEAQEAYQKSKSANAAAYVPIPGEYKDPITSTLRYTVVSGPQEHRIDLK